MASDETHLKALFLKGLAGDADAHRAFLAEAAGALRAYFRNRLRNAPEDAEDLVQETLIAVHTKRDTFDPRYPLSAWLYAIARYRLIDFVRRKKRRGIAIPIEDADDALFSAPAQEASDARRDVAALLERLPEKQRRAIQLIKLEQKSVREASALTGWSESDLKVSAHRGLKTLARLFREEESA
ncbi:MAG: sigma-70 family RNA polymerase sigma factor [Alphaproteobacteria bacterium]|nr:sigma-70 family RNA polymerase sigma factor [Alphaproteobacteria bacterium]